MGRRWFLSLLPFWPCPASGKGQTMASASSSRRRTSSTCLQSFSLRLHARHVPMTLRTFFTTVLKLTLVTFWVPSVSEPLSLQSGIAASASVKLWPTNCPRRSGLHFVHFAPTCHFASLLKMRTHLCDRKMTNKQSCNPKKKKKTLKKKKKKKKKKS